MAAITAEFKTGLGGTLTIGSTSWAKARVINLPKDVGSVVKTPHLSGLSVQPDGRTDFGQLVAEIAEDGTASMLSDTQVTWSILVASISKTFSGTGYVTGDDRGKLQRGQALVRTITIDSDAAYSLV
jgi:hypothetical protein